MYGGTESGGVKGMELGTVTLSTALVPPPGIRSPAEAPCVEMDGYDFFRSHDDLLASMDTNIPGVYIAGVCARPVDVTSITRTAELPTGPRGQSGSMGRARQKPAQGDRR